MTIGVLIPVYNGEETIRETLQSVMAQTELPYEVCIVDDGSTDRTADIIRRFSHENPGPLWKIISQDNGGLGAARNAGLEVMTADYIALLDADDRWSTDKLAHAKRFLQNYPDTDIAYHPIWEWSANSGRLRKRRIQPLSDVSSLWFHNPITPSATILRREAMNWHFETDPSIHGVEDALLWTEAMAKGVTFREMPHIDTYYRIGHGMTAHADDHDEKVMKAAELALSKGWINGEILDATQAYRSYHRGRMAHKDGQFETAIHFYKKAPKSFKLYALQLFARLGISI